MAQQGQQRKVARAEVVRTIEGGLKGNDPVRLVGLEALLGFRGKKLKLREREEVRLVAKYGEKAPRLRTLREKQDANLDMARGLKIELNRAKTPPPKIAKNCWAVQGRVYDRTAAPVANARVALYSLDEQKLTKVSETKTDTTGFYKLTYEAKAEDIVEEKVEVAKPPAPAQGEKVTGQPEGGDEGLRINTKVQEGATVFVRASIGDDQALRADSLPIVPRPGVFDYRDILFNVDLLATCRPATEKDRRATRFLGNSSTRELHDLNNEKPGCRIDKIRFDHCVNFKAVEVATGASYDFCAFCFRKDKSKR